MLAAFLKKTIQTGRLTVVGASPEPQVYGENDPDPALDVEMRLKSPGTALWLALSPELHFGEAYMSGELTVKGGEIWPLMNLIGLNLRNRPTPLPLNTWLKRRQEVLRVNNSLKTAKQNVAHHYDLSEELYRAFLDDDMQYSCAYFAREDMSLEDAQLAKKLHLIAKLDLKPGQRVLDIGCGWGGLALEIARRADVDVTGITLSQEQLAVANRRAASEGLDDRVHFQLCDYRELEGEFDRIISVGMFEHVGPGNYSAYFEAIKRLLKPDGVAIIHSIGHEGSTTATNAWLDKYIFPGGYIPSVSQVSSAVEAIDLWITDVEILRLHYAETLRHWRHRFMARRASLAALYDERFCRMWEFYLAFSEIGFRYGNLMVLQMQITRRGDVLPLTRNYMMEGETGRSAGATDA